jgi:hypothetical protein
MDTKETWESPQLVVLVRGKPEERVLDACKSIPFGGSTGANSTANGCSMEQCGNDCSGITLS